jgi:hypothetical protein
MTALCSAGSFALVMIGAPFSAVFVRASHV